MSISPTSPPPGMPESTTPLSTATATALAKVPAPSKGMLKTPKRKAIFRMPLRQDPSMWAVAPMGSTTSPMSSGIPILRAASRFTGRVAVLLWVPNAVMAAGRMFLQKVAGPLRPAAQAE